MKIFCCLSRLFFKGEKREQRKAKSKEKQRAKRERKTEE